MSTKVESTENAATIDGLQYVSGISISDNSFIEFTAITKNLGRAEFEICPIFKRNKLVEIHIYRSQQEKKEHFFWKGNPKITFTVQGYEDLDAPKIWHFHYCKEHKSQSFRLYVPNNSKYLWFSVHSDEITIGFTKTKW